MPKMKTKSSAKKRFRMNKNGVIKRGCQNRSHIMTKKSSKRKMKMRAGSTVAKADQPKVARALQV